MRRGSLLIIVSLIVGMGAMVGPANATGSTTYAWGNGTLYALGNGSTSSSLTPTTVVDGAAFTSIAAGDQFACGLTSDGVAYCWGRGDAGSIGNGTDVNAATPTRVSGGLSFEQIDAGGQTACGVTTGGAVYCWGDNASGQTGTPAGTSFVMSPSVVPTGGTTSVPAGTTFAQVAVGDAHACALTRDGTAYCWGSGLNGTLGNGLTASTNEPVAVSGSHTFSLLALGGDHSCGLVGGAAYCWGKNTEGQVGNGNNSDALTPDVVLGGLSFTTITAGSGHTCAIVSGGSAYCWGLNVLGQLGDGGVASRRNTPGSVSGGLTFTSLSAGYLYTCGVQLGGAGWCWGYGGSGKLGNGSDDDALIPTLVSGSLTFRSLVTGDSSAYGIAEPSSDQADQRPPDHLQQIEPQADGTCTGIDDRGLGWGTGLTGGWGPSWAQWARGGAGGPVCTRTLTYAQNLAWRIA